MFTKFLSTRDVELIRFLSIDDIQLLLMISDTVLKTDKHIYIQTGSPTKKLSPNIHISEIDQQFAKQISAYIQKNFKRNNNWKIEFFPKNDTATQMQDQMKTIFKQLSEESDIYYDEKEFIFEEIRKHHDHDKFIYVFKKYLDDGFHVESYKTIDTEPYYVQHGISLLYSRGDMSEFEDVLPDFDRWSSTPYFILNYSLYKDGVSVGPSFVMGRGWSGPYTMDGEEYNFVPYIVNGNGYYRPDYFKFLPELNIKFREKYGYLDDFLDSPEDDVYVMQQSDINFNTSVLE